MSIDRSESTRSWEQPPGDLGVPGTLARGHRRARGAPAQTTLQNIDVDVPLWRTVAVVGVSGFGPKDVAGPSARLVRRGDAPVPGRPEHLQPTAPDPKAQRPDVDRIDYLPARAGRCGSAPPDPRAAQHGRHHVRGTQRCFALMIVAAGLASVARTAHPRRSVDRHDGRGRSSAPWTARHFEHPPAPSPSRLTRTARCPACPGPGRAPPR